MKTIVQFCLSSFLFLWCGAAWAQPGKKDWTISGSLGFSNLAPKGNYETYWKRKSAQFNPAFGTFVTKRINTGVIVQLSYNNSDQKYYSSYTNGLPTGTTVQKEITVNYSLGGYLSYYYPLSEKLFLVNTAIISFGRSNYWNSSSESQKFELSRPTGKSDVVSATHILSIEYFIRSTVGLSLGLNTLNYSKAFYYVQENENNSASNVSLFNPTLQVKLNLLLKYED